MHVCVPLRGNHRLADNRFPWLPFVALEINVLPHPTNIKCVSMVLWFERKYERMWEEITTHRPYYGQYALQPPAVNMTINCSQLMIVLGTCMTQDVS